MIPGVKKVKEKLIIDGDFKFKTSPTIIGEDLNPYTQMSFLWSLELAQDIQFLKQDEILELYAEKLKQNFIEFHKG